MPSLLPRIANGIPTVLLLCRVPEYHIVDQGEKRRLDWLGWQRGKGGLQEFQGSLPGLELDRQEHSEEVFVVVLEVNQGGERS